MCTVALGLSSQGPKKHQFRMTATMLHTGPKESKSSWQGRSRYIKGLVNLSANGEHVTKPSTYQQISIKYLYSMLLRTWFHHVSHKGRASSRNFEPGLFQSCANSKEGNHIDIARAQTSNSKGFSDVSFLPMHARNSILLQKIAPKPGQHDAQHLTQTRKLVRNPCFFTRDIKGGAQYPTKTGFKKGFPQCT